VNALTNLGIFFPLVFMDFTNKITVECRELLGWVQRSIRQRT
jgi:hypothetical protein